MSMEDAKSFIERMKTDEEFAKKVTAAKDAEERMAVAREAGFNFTTSEINEAAGELSEGDLDIVAGGHHNPHCHPVWHVHLRWTL